MFTESAAIYDAIYASRRDVAAEAARLHGLIQRYKRTADTTLLDVTRGTGAFLVHLRGSYTVEGLDLDPGMLAVARQKLPDVPFHQADVAEFDLGRRFDAVVCLGSSIGYAKTVPRLHRTLRTLAHHLLPGGVVVVEPWFTPNVWDDGRLSADLTNQPRCKVLRSRGPLNRTRRMMPLYSR